MVILVVFNSVLSGSKFGKKPNFICARRPHITLLVRCSVVTILFEMEKMEAIKFAP